MTVVAQAYGKTLVSLLTKRLDLTTDPIKVALVSSTYTPDFANHQYFSDVTGEITGGSYTAGGATLAHVSLSYDPDTRQVALKADDVVWTGAFTAVAAVAYVSLSTAASSPLLQHIDFGGSLSVATGDPFHLSLGGGLLSLGAFTPQNPPPLGTDKNPLLLADSTGGIWRTLTLDTGALVTNSTSQPVTGLGATYLTDSASTLWLLSVDGTGALSTTSGGTPATGDITYSASNPLLLPSIDPRKTFRLDVGTDGTLTTTEVTA